MPTKRDKQAVKETMTGKKRHRGRFCIDASCIGQGNTMPARCKKKDHTQPL